MNKNNYRQAFLYKSKWIQPYIQYVLNIVNICTYLAAFALLAALVYEHGFPVAEREVDMLGQVYQGVWIVFLTSISLHLLLEYRDTRKNFKWVAWALSALLYLTLVPVIFFEPEAGLIRQVWLLFHSRTYHLIVLLLLSLLQLSNGLVRLLGRRTNPSLILASSFLVIIGVGTGLLLLPKCTYGGISWIDALFTATSATCVTGLVTVDVAATFTPQGLLVILLLIQIGGLGVMTLTSFFALFFMGNTSVYNQLVVRDMVSSDSLDSLFSTLLYILGFTLALEAVGMFLIFVSIHDTLGLTWQEEIAFSAFHAVSAFCNAGFSTWPGSLGHPTVLYGHNLLFITLGVLVVLGGIGYPILVNFKSIVAYHLRRIFKSLFKKRKERRQIHLLNLNTKIVLAVTTLLVLGATAFLAVFEWNGAFAALPVTDKLTQAFFNAVCPRTAGFTSISLTGFTTQSIFFMLLLMAIGGGSQSTAGGIKVNAFAVAVLNLWTVLRGGERVEVFGRELPYDSIRRSDATILMYLLVLFLGVFVLSLLEPEHSLLALTFECVSALSTVGASLDVTPTLSVSGKLLVSFLMFVGRVGMITLVLGFIRPKRVTKYRYPTDNIIIN